MNRRSDGRLEEKRRYLNDTLYEVTTWNYDANNRPLARTVNGVEREAWAYPAANSIFHRAEDGTRRTTVSDDAGRPISATVHGSTTATTAYGATLPARADVVTTWIYAPRPDGLPGQRVTTTVTAAGVSRTSYVETDGAGRQTGQKSTDGTTRSWTYGVTPGGTYETRTYSGLYGATGGTLLEETKRQRDGSLQQTGPFPSRYYTHAIDASFSPSVSTYDSSLILVSTVTRDGIGRTVSDYHVKSVHPTTGFSLYETSLYTYDENYNFESRSRTSPAGGVVYDVRKSFYEAGALWTLTGTSTNDAYWDTADTNLRRHVSSAAIDPAIPAITVGTWTVSYGWQTESRFLPFATGSYAPLLGWETNAASIRKSPLSQRPVASWMGHTANSIPQSWSNDGGTIITEAEARSLTAASPAVLSTEHRTRRTNSDYRKVISRDGVSSVFSSPEAANRQLLYNAFLEPLEEFSWEAMPHFPKLERNSVGQVTARLLPGSLLYSEKYEYYTELPAPGSDHRAGRLKSSTTWSYPTGVSGGQAKGITYYHYDAAGNTLAQWGSGSPVTLYTYDAEGRMTHLRTFRTAPSIPLPDSWQLQGALDAAVAAPTVATTLWTYPFGSLRLVRAKKYQDQSGSVEYTYHADGSLASRKWERTENIQGSTNRLLTSYTYSGAGHLTATVYGSTAQPAGFAPGHVNYTPPVYLAYDRAGRVRFRTDGTGVTRLEYRYDGSPTTEFTVASAVEGAAIVPTGKHFQRSYDALGRLSTGQSAWGAQIVGQSSSGTATHSPYFQYNYTGPDRLSTVWSAGFMGTLTKTSAQETFSVNPYTGSSSPPSVYSTIYRDGQGRPSSHTAGGAAPYYNGTTYPFTISSTTFGWDADRLASRTESPDATWNYIYDEKSQVRDAFKTVQSAGQPVTLNGSESRYSYDDIGNRTSLGEGPNFARVTSYGANALNQYTGITRPQTFSVSGRRNGSAAAIAVNGTAVTTFQPTSTGLYFYRQESNTPTTWQTGDIFEPLYVTQNGSRISDAGALQYVGPPVETLTHDADGNLLSDGRWAYTWDGENRLVRMQALAWTQPTTPTPAYQAPTNPEGIPPNSLESITLEFSYDGLSRRVSRKTIRNGDVANPDNEGYLYDSWNVVMISKLNSDGSHNLRKWSCIWRPDVGSTLYARTSWQQAGGVGGLAWMQTGIAQTFGYSTGNAEVHIPIQDHMGNVRQYYQYKITAGSITGQTVANFEYDAFGREVRAWGLNTPAAGSQPPGLPASRPWVDQLPFHFSTKFTDAESGLNYYGYRFYDPLNGRWLNRDPIGERGGINLMAYITNKPTSNYDALGLKPPPTPGGPRKSPASSQPPPPPKPTRQSGIPHPNDWHGFYCGSNRINGKIYPNGQEGMKPDDIGPPHGPDAADETDACCLKHDKCLAAAKTPAAETECDSRLLLCWAGATCAPNGDFLSRLKAMALPAFLFAHTSPKEETEEAKEKNDTGSAQVTLFRISF